MKTLLPNFNKEWLEEKFTFGFTGKKSVPEKKAAPLVTPEEQEATDLADKTLREEKFNKKKYDARKKGSLGRFSLLGKGNTESGLKDTLG